MPTVLTPSSADGELNGTSEVTIVPAPGASTQRLVRWLSVHNADTVIIELFLYFANGASRRTIWHGIMEPGDTIQFDDNDVITLEAGKSIVAKMGSLASTAEPEWITGWADKSTS